MNPKILAHFDRLEQRLLESNAVSGYIVTQHEVSLVDGKVRIRVRLRDGGLLELFEYVVVNVQGDVTRSKYAYHWQDAKGLLVRRWDAVSHYPQLPGAPHHVHLPDGSVQGIEKPLDAIEALAQIETSLRQQE